MTTPEYLRATPKGTSIRLRVVPADVAAALAADPETNRGGPA